MNLYSALITTYLHINVSLCAAALLSVFLLCGVKSASMHMRPSNALRIAHSLIAVVVLLPVITILLPQKNVIEPTAQIWSAPSMHEIADNGSFSGAGSYFSIDAMNASHIVSFDLLTAIISGFILVGICIYLIRIVTCAVSIRRILKCSHLFRVIGKVRLYASEHMSVPFSVWLPGRFIVVIPTSIIEIPESFFISVFHELQHHRQRDTFWIHVLQMLKNIFFWNPLVYIMAKNICEIQEMSCDEFLVDRRKISPIAYSRCLISIAEIAYKSSIPSGTLGMPSSLPGKKLERRMDIMFADKYLKKNFSSTLLCAVLCFCFMTSIAFASKGLVQDRRISLEEAKIMAKNVPGDMSFPIVVNDSVLMQLNSYLGTPDGRTYMRDALSRMAAHRKAIEEKLAEYGAPKALLALPLIESGYRNLPQGKDALGAGLWQFIPPTAKHYGLRVDDIVDERLDVDIETDAAIRYIMANNFRFSDWGLSLIAYNAGGAAVQKGIDATGSRDPWTLIKAGYENDKGYLGKFVAALIIMCNPSSLE